MDEVWPGATVLEPNSEFGDQQPFTLGVRTSYVSCAPSHSFASSASAEETPPRLKALLTNLSVWLFPAPLRGV